MAKEIVASQRAEVVARSGEGMAGRLERAVLKGFDRVDEYLGLEAGDDAEILRHQAELATSLIRTQVRLDESQFRAQSEERFLTILEQLRQAEMVPLPVRKKGKP